jgi:V-type H+-transporting ATPase subunit a
MNPEVTPFQRSYVNEIRRMDEMARRLRFFQNQIEKESEKIQTRPLWDSAPLVTVSPKVQQTIDKIGCQIDRT